MGIIYAVKYGGIGVIAICTILSFKLLSAEQKREFPRRVIIGAVFVLQVISLFAILMGILISKHEQQVFLPNSYTRVSSQPLKAPSSKNDTKQSPFRTYMGFPSGALDGEWELVANDTLVFNNLNFKKPTYSYRGKVIIKQIDSMLYFEGYLELRDIHNDTLIFPTKTKIEGFGPLNNNYVGVQYFFSEGKRNGYGVFLAKFNNDAETADVFFLIRPTNVPNPFGLVFGRLKHNF